jgi:hypothetical protein
VVTVAGRPIPKWLEFTPDERSSIKSSDANPERFCAELTVERDEVCSVLRASGVDPDRWLLARVEEFRAKISELMATPAIQRLISRH